MNLHTYEPLTKEHSRNEKEERVQIEDWHKHATLEEKEERSLQLIETAIRKVGLDAKIVVSCSYGIDSIVTLHLVRRVADKLGIEVEVVWNNTLNEFPQTRKFAAEITALWNLKAIEARPETTLIQIYQGSDPETLLRPKRCSGRKATVARTNGLSSRTVAENSSTNRCEKRSRQISGCSCSTVYEQASRVNAG